MYHSNYDRMPVTHARQITGRWEGGEPMTADEWARYGGYAEDFPQLVREANAILDSITLEQELLLKTAVTDLSINMNDLQCQIRDQALCATEETDEGRDARLGCDRNANLHDLAQAKHEALNDPAALAWVERSNREL